MEFLSLKDLGWVFSLVHPPNLSLIVKPFLKAKAVYKKNNKSCLMKELTGKVMVCLYYRRGVEPKYFKLYLELENLASKYVEFYLNYVGLLRKTNKRFLKNKVLTFYAGNLDARPLLEAATWAHAHCPTNPHHFNQWRSHRGLGVRISLPLWQMWCYI